MFFRLVIFFGILWSPFSFQNTHATEAAQGAQGSEVRLLSVDGVINPLTARYLEREVRSAEEAGVEAVVLMLDTPGGLETSTREMSQTLLGANVPVIVYVAPAGAHAASAGMFITLAANIAAMAPGTNIGSAHPVAIGGGAPGEPPSESPEGEEIDPIAAKIIEDVAALARSIARERGRNADWAEEAVRRSVSVTAYEALELNVIDEVAIDLAGLLQQVDGQELTLRDRAVILATADAEIIESPMNLAERILHIITNPNIAYLLLTIGFIGIIAELYSPGMFFPGITGVISLMISFVGMGSLPLGWAGIALIGLAIALFLAELLTEGIGVFGIAGLVSFVFGSLMLYEPLSPVSPAMPVVRVSPRLIVAMSVLIVGFFMWILRAVARARKRPVTTGIEGLKGMSGQAMTDLSPSGLVRVAGEEWSAELSMGEKLVRKGQEIEIVDVQGVRLIVKRKLAHLKKPAA
jgi:membrane-bound serine protease (ClpP class)